MATQTPKQKFSNITGVGGAKPIPNLRIPTLGSKLTKIDPEGSAAFQASLQKEVDDWVGKLNVVFVNLGGQIK
jgi:hypothetical protein